MRFPGRLTFAKSVRPKAGRNQLLPCLSILLALTGCGSGIRQTGEFPMSINEKTVFLGDSITAYWGLPTHNAGIPGETTAEIAARFQTDVVQSGLPQVIILAGANDVRLGNPDYANVMANLQKMVAEGRAAGIKVILCELTPITCCDTDVQTLNAMIKQYATAQNLILVDYYTPMAGQDSTYLKDGLHPNVLGYSVMEDVLTKALTELN